MSTSFSLFQCTINYHSTCCFDFNLLLFVELKQKKKKNKEEASELGLKAVKDKYKDVDDYLSTFEPLLFEEVKAQITQLNEDEGSFSFLQFKFKLLFLFFSQCVMEHALQFFHFRLKRQILVF